MPLRVTVQEVSNAVDGWISLAPHDHASPLFHKEVKISSIELLSSLGVAEVPSADSHYAAKLYDAILLYSHAVTVALPRSLHSGREVLDIMRNISFQGKGGRIQLDPDGEQMESISVASYQVVDSHLVTVEVGIYEHSSGCYKEVVPKGSMLWPGGGGEVPSALGTQTNKKAFVYAVYTAK